MALPDSGWGKPKNRLGISSSTETFFLNLAVSFCRAKNGGATTFSGNSSTLLSWADTTGRGAGLIQERKVFQVKATRPCLSARSTTSVGNATLASTRFNCTSSWRTASGQPSAREIRLTSSGLDSAVGLEGGGVGAAGATAGGTGRWLLLKSRSARAAAFIAGARSGIAAGGGGVGANVNPLRAGGMAGADVGAAA